MSPDGGLFGLKLSIYSLFSDGPFFILCKVNGKSVYWKVNESISDTKEEFSLTETSATKDKSTQTNASAVEAEPVARTNCHQLLGTELIEEASLFYIIPSENTSHVCDFSIAYWGKKCRDRKILTNLLEPHAKKRKTEPLLPRYLSADSGILGKHKGPLELHSTVLVQHARFCLHSRVQSSFPLMMCTSTPVPLSSWIEGEEFFINCSQRSFKIDGYIAMTRNSKSNPTYKTITMPINRNPTNRDDVGVLFRLRSSQCAKRNKSRNGPSPSVQPGKSKSKMACQSESGEDEPDAGVISSETDLGGISSDSDIGSDFDCVDSD